MKNTGILVIGLSVVFGLAVAESRAQAPARESNLPKLVGDILWWLPEDTQTIMVSQGPYSADAPDSGKSADALGLERVLRGYPDDDHLEPELRRRLRSRTIALSLAGSRRFRFPGGLGEMRYEGAQIVVFQDDLGADGKNLMDSLSKQATSVETISGVPVVSFDGKVLRSEWDRFWGLPGEKAEADPWPSYVAFPRANILIWATDRGYLISLLARMAKRGAARAFPATLPEWNHLDARAKIWAIRHYDRKDATHDPTSPLTGETAADSPDNRALGLVFWVDPRDRNSATLKYLSANRNAIGIARKYWDQPQGKFARRFRQAGPGVVEISITTEQPNGERDVGMFLFLLLNALGHGVCL